MSVVVCLFFIFYPNIITNKWNNFRGWKCTWVHMPNTCIFYIFSAALFCWHCNSFFSTFSCSQWGFFKWVSCSLFFISYRPFHSPSSCISRSPGSAERACGASPWQRWPPCWCPALPLGQDAALQQQLAGQVASEEENGVQHTFNIKVGKYSERCEAEGIVFIPLVVDRFGGWHKDSLEISPSWVGTLRRRRRR